MDDLKGWQQTRWGMTADEIIRVVGVENLRRFEETKQYQDSYADLTIPDVYIGSYAFDLIFQMSKESKGLKQVLISYEEDPEKSPTAAFRAAVKMLTEKFGSPERIGTSDDFHWRFATTTIEAAEMFMDGIVSMASVRFFPSEEAASTKNFPAF